MIPQAENITLKGWSQPLPEEAVAAIRAGTLRVVLVTFKGESYELLQGTYVTKDGLTKVFT